jgi:hypothetical protein
MGKMLKKKYQMKKLEAKWHMLCVPCLIKRGKQWVGMQHSGRVLA